MHHWEVGGTINIGWPDHGIPERPYTLVEVDQHGQVLRVRVWVYLFRRCSGVSGVVCSPMKLVKALLLLRTLRPAPKSPFLKAS